MYRLTWENVSVDCDRFEGLVDVGDLEYSIIEKLTKRFKDLKIGFDEDSEMISEILVYNDEDEDEILEEFNPEFDEVTIEIPFEICLDNDKLGTTDDVDDIDEDYLDELIDLIEKTFKEVINEVSQNTSYVSDDISKEMGFEKVYYEDDDEDYEDYED